MRVAVVSYLNALPLTVALEQDDRLDLRPMPPADVAARLAANEADVGLVPTAALLADPELVRVPGIGIGADGNVDTVILHVRDQARGGRVALDPESRTSQVLTRILLPELVVWGHEAEFVQEPSHRAVADPTDWDAILVIGDKAFDLPAPDGFRTIDLGAAWSDATDLPFVFAVWGVRSAALQAAPWLPRALMDAMEQGLARRPEIARHFAETHDIDEARALFYLEHRIRYRMAARDEAGLNEFLRRARRVI